LSLRSASAARGVPELPIGHASEHERCDHDHYGDPEHPATYSTGVQKKEPQCQVLQLSQSSIQREVQTSVIVAHEAKSGQ
jgi:hypothetical protein